METLTQEEVMQTALVTSIARIAVLAALLFPSAIVAQDTTTTTTQAQHHRYQLIDLGTLGGPNSSAPEVFYEIDNGTAGARVVSDSGAMIALSDTSASDPLCFFDDCFYPGTVEWRSGTSTNLGALPGSQWSGPSWISGNGLVAGVSENGETDPLLGVPELRAVLWRLTGISDLGTLPGGSESFAFAVNNRGQVVGLATNGTADPYSYWYAQVLGFSNGTQTRAFAWDIRDGMQDLGTLGGPDAWAGLVNERGQVAGISLTSFTANSNNGATCAANVPTQDPFLWSKSIGMIDVGGFGGTCGAPQALNDHGQLVGGSYLAGNSVVHGFLFDQTGHPRLKDLGTLGGDNSAALWIDDAGDVVGYADIPNPPACNGVGCVHHAFLWRNGVMTDLGSVDGDPCSRGISVNSRGQVVGATAAICGATLTHGFLWEDGGPAADLNSLVSGADMTLNLPLYINDRGEIGGEGTLANGDVHAFLLIPCDEQHPGLQGCDYSMVQRSPTQPNLPRSIQSSHLANHVASAASLPPNPMSRRFRSRLGLWSRSFTPAKPASNGANAGLPLLSQGVSSEPIVNLDKADQNSNLYCWPGHCAAGHCWLEQNAQGQWVTNGYCWADVWPTCRASSSSTCPSGQRGLQPEYALCGGLGMVVIDNRRPCTVHF
jgi:probable HAF family extracellular repeat protein